MYIWLVEMNLYRDHTARTSKEFLSSSTLTVNSNAYRQADNSQSDAMSDISAPSSSTTSRSKASHPAISSFPGCQDNCSTDHESSSQSQTSSKVSNAATERSSAKADSDTMEGVINNELRDDPEVAKLLCKLLDGKLDYAPKGHVEKDLQVSDLLTALNVNTFDNPRPIWHHGVFKYAPSSDSNSSSSSSANNPEGAKNSSNPSGSNSGNVSGSSNTKLGKDSFEDAGPGQFTKQHKGKSRLGAPMENEPHGLRCFHNAALPETFCTNNFTKNHFRACAGAGWFSWQHLK